MINNIPPEKVWPSKSPDKVFVVRILFREGKIWYMPLDRHSDVWLWGDRLSINGETCYSKIKIQ